MEAAVPVVEPRPEDFVIAAAILSSPLDVLRQINDARNYLLSILEWINNDNDKPQLLLGLSSALLVVTIEPDNERKKNCQALYKSRNALYPNELLLRGDIKIKDHPQVPLFALMMQYQFKLGDFRKAKDRKVWEIWGFFRYEDNRSFFSLVGLLNLFEQHIMYWLWYKKYKTHGNEGKAAGSGKNSPDDQTTRSGDSGSDNDNNGPGPNDKKKC